MESEREREREGGRRAVAGSLGGDGPPLPASLPLKPVRRVVRPRRCGARAELFCYNFTARARAVWCAFSCPMRGVASGVGKRAAGRARDGVSIAGAQGQRARFRREVWFY